MSSDCEKGFFVLDSCFWTTLKKSCQFQINICNLPVDLLQVVQIFLYLSIPILIFFLMKEWFFNQLLKIKFLRSATNLIVFFYRLCHDPRTYHHFNSNVKYYSCQLVSAYFYVDTVILLVILFLTSFYWTMF